MGERHNCVADFTARRREEFEVKDEKQGRTSLLHFSVNTPTATTKVCEIDYARVKDLDPW